MDLRVAKCLLIVKVLVADGIMTDREKAFLDLAMTRLGLSDAECASVFRLDGWDEAEGVVANLSDDEKRAFLDELAHAALVDRQLSAYELDAVEAIGKALGV